MNKYETEFTWNNDKLTSMDKPDFSGNYIDEDYDPLNFNKIKINPKINPLEINKNYEDEEEDVTDFD
jgi:hypothetical protein